MKIFLLGANGRTGRRVIKLATGAGHEVTAVVRSPDRLAPADQARVQMHVADACSAPALEALLPGHDIVISVLGPRWPTQNSARIYRASAEALVEAMPKSGVQRLLVTSSGLLFDTRNVAARMLAWLVSPLVESAVQMEARIRASDLDWTIARTSFLNDANESALAALPASQVDPHKLGKAVSRNAVASFLVSEATSPQHQKQIVGLFGHATRKAGALSGAART